MSVIGSLKSSLTSLRRRRQRVFAIGDVHGCHEELRRLVTLMPIEEDSLVVFLGDYIDRGPSSRDVVDAILELSTRCRVKCMLGNHELMLREFFEASDPRRVARFIYNGGGSTLASYSDEEGIFTLPEAHKAFFESLEYFHVEGDHCFVHAGLPVDIEEVDVAEHGEEMVWMRRQPGVPERKSSKIVVHGHTPLPEVEIAPYRINIDTSCVYGRRLTAMDVHTHELWHVDRSTADMPTYLRDVRDSRRQAFRFTGNVPVSVIYEGRPLKFETINYSEIGILIRPTDPLEDTHIGPGSIISGVIGIDEGATAFQGVVMRVDSDDRFAIKLLSRKAAL